MINWYSNVFENSQSVKRRIWSIITCGTWRPQVELPWGHWRRLWKDDKVIVRSFWSLLSVHSSPNPTLVLTISSFESCTNVWTPQTVEFIFGLNSLSNVLSFYLVWLKRVGPKMDQYKRYSNNFIRSKSIRNVSRTRRKRLLWWTETRS